MCIRDSFKLAQLLRDEPRVDKVIFLIDRKDLDDQTVDEYNSFEKGCVDGSDSTAVLVKQLKQADRKLIVTTIQKMANAVKSKRYEALMDSYRDKKVVFIIDECHRSQFGKMHGDIQRHFRNANYIGFTGTPIFEANKGKMCIRDRHRPRHGQAQERPAEQTDGLLRGGSPAGRAEDEMGGP